MKTTIRALALGAMFAGGMNACIEHHSDASPDEIAAVRAMVARRTQMDSVKAAQLVIEVSGTWARVTESGRVNWFACRQGATWDLVAAGPGNRQPMPDGTGDRAHCTGSMPSAWQSR